MNALNSSDTAVVGGTNDPTVSTNCPELPQGPPSEPSPADAVTVHPLHAVLIVDDVVYGTTGMCTTTTHNVLEHDLAGVALVKVNRSAGVVADEPAAVVTTTWASCGTPSAGVVARRHVL